MLYRGFHIEFLSSVDIAKKLGVSQGKVEDWAKEGKVLRLRNYMQTSDFCPLWLYPWNDIMYYDESIMFNPKPEMDRMHRIGDYQHFKNFVEFLSRKNYEYGLATKQEVTKEEEICKIMQKMEL